MRVQLLLLATGCLIPNAYRKSDPGLIGPGGIAFNYADDFDYLLIPAFKKGVDETIKYRISFSNIKTRNVVITCRYSMLNNSWKELYTGIFTERTAVGEFTFSHPFQSLGYDIDVRIMVKEGSYNLINKTHVAKTYDEKILNRSNIVNRRFTTSDCIYTYTHTEGSKYNHESYLFSGLDSPYALNYGYVLNLTKFNFTFSFPYYEEFTSTKAVLYIKNYNHVFDDMDPDPVTQNVTLPLRAKQNPRSLAYYFYFKEKYYVDPLTQRMSKEYKEGYVNTSFFFFPKDFAITSNNYSFTLALGDVGYAKNYSSLGFSISTDKSLVGLCGEGTYCVNSETSTPDFELGETVTY